MGGRDAPAADEIENALNEHKGFAAAGPRENLAGPLNMMDGFLLGRTGADIPRTR